MNKTKTPNNWKQLAITDVFDFIRTCSHSKDKMSYEVGNEDDVYNIHYGDIHALYNDYVDFYKDNVPFLLDRTECIPKDKFLKNGDLVMVDASEDYNGVGASIEIKNIDNKKCIAGLHVFALRDKSNMTVSGYRRLSVSHPLIKKRLKQISTYSKVYGISKTGLSKVNLILPPLPEQHRIVAVLEAWDKAIDLLKKKIALKKEVKKGLMQKLLSGEVRLPGFDGEWKSVKLGDVAYFYNGYAFKSLTYIENGIYKIITISSVQDGYMVSDDCNTVDVLPSDMRPHQKLNIGDILISMTGNVGRVCKVTTENCLLNQRVGKIVPVDIDSDLFFYIVYTRKFLQTMIDRAQGGAQGNISISDIKGYEFIAPKDKKEQQAIASILITADNEITLLEQKLHALEQQKKFLLNNLVTGEIRTPEDLLVHA